MEYESAHIPWGSSSLANPLQKSEEGRNNLNIQLRKRHRLMWYVLGIGLPLLCLQAIENIPKDPLADINRHVCAAGLEICGFADSYENPVLETELNEAKLKLKLLAPLKSAFTTVYVSNEQELSSSAQIIGQLNSMGNYEFDLPSENYEYLLLVDEIKGTALFHSPLKRNQP